MPVMAGYRSFRSARGSVLVLVAFWLPLMILFFAFVVDVGDAYVHRRHLQTQADAAALAGGGSFSLPCSDTSIESSARDFGGASAITPTAHWNSQIGGTPASRIHVVLNSSQYYNENPLQPAASGGYGDLGNPCSAGFLDVKVTETDLPLFFGNVPLFAGASSHLLSNWSAINAHARVSLLQETTMSGSIPVAVPDPGFAVTAGEVDFINEDTGAILGSAPLTSAGGGAFNNASAPVTVDMNGVSHAGAVVKLSGATPPPATVTCGQPLVECYDLSSIDASGTPARGLIFVHGFPTAGYSTGVGGEPVVKGVTLTTPGGASGCTNPFFFTLTTGSCQLGVQAVVSFADASGNNRSVSATLSDYGSPPDYMKTNSLKNTAGSTWASDGTGQGKYFDVPAQEGPVKVTLGWTKKAGTYNGNPCSTSNPCSGTWNGYVFQRTMSGSDPHSGPIAAAALYEGDATSNSPSTNSFADDGASTTHRLFVNLQMQPALGYATSVDSPKVNLRVEGSQNQTIDCDPSLPNLRQELDFGCGPKYTVNEVLAGGFATDCSSWPTSNMQWSPPQYAQPWPCVSVQTGGAGGQVTPGIEDRMLRLTNGSTSCPTNNWSSFPSFSVRDPRLVPVILTPFGTFGGSGNANIPVTGFAEFYITGWAKQGMGSKKPQPDCTGDDAPPGADYIVGHFVRYVDTLNTGGGTTACSPSTFGNCVVVLTQ